MRASSSRSRRAFSRAVSTLRRSRARASSSLRNCQRVVTSPEVASSSTPPAPREEVERLDAVALDVVTRRSVLPESPPRSRMRACHPADDPEGRPTRVPSSSWSGGPSGIAPDERAGERALPALGV